MTSEKYAAAGKTRKESTMKRNKFYAIFFLIAIIMHCESEKRTMNGQDIGSKSPRREEAVRLNRDGLALLNSGRYADALELFIEAARANPNEAEYPNNSGTCRLRLKEARNALKDFERAASIDPKSPLYRFNIGLAHMYLGENDLAAARFREAAEIDDACFPAWSHLGLVYFQEKRYVEAEAAWQRASALKEDAEVQNNLGMIYMERNDLQAAELRFAEAVRIDGRFLLAHYNLGVLYQKRNENERAERAYSSAIALDQAYFTAYYNRALVELAQGKERVAARSLELFIQYCPTTLSQPLHDAKERLAGLKKKRLH